MTHQPHRLRKTVLFYAFPAFLCAMFLLFFRAFWGFKFVSFDESCYVEYVHRFVGLSYPTCYSHSHFPGISILWIPFALVGRLFAKFTGEASVTTWIVTLTGFASFVFWCLSLYFVAGIWEFYRSRLVHFSRWWTFPVLFLLSCPVLPYAMQWSHLSHAGELMLALAALHFLIRKQFVASCFAMVWLVATRLNDAPIVFMLLGALVDQKSNFDLKWFKRLVPFIAVLVAAILVFVIRVAFFTGYHGIMLADIVQSISWEGFFRVLFTKHLGMFWFTPHWLFVFGFGILKFHSLSWTSRAGLVWLASVLAFHVGHAIWWGGDVQQIRYLIGSYAAVLFVTLELLPLFSQMVRRFNFAAMIVGSALLVLYSWAGADTNTAGQIIDGTLFSDSVQSVAYDKSSMGQFSRKLIFEPLGASPIGFSIFSIFKDRSIFSRFHTFARYGLSGQNLWFLVFLSFTSLIAFIAFTRKTLSEWLSIIRGVSSLRYEVDEEKISRLVEHSRTSCNEIPRIGLFLVKHGDFSQLIATLNRIHPAVVNLIDEVFMFDYQSFDGEKTPVNPFHDRVDWKNKVKIYRNLRNTDYGANQKIGFQYAIDRGMDYVILLHGDGLYAPESLTDLILEAVQKKKKVVLGSRMFELPTDGRGGMPVMKWLGNRISTHFANLMLGLNLSDFHSGFRMYATEVLRRIPFSENSNELNFDCQLFIQCRALGIEISEVAVPMFHDIKIGSPAALKNMLEAWLSIFKYRLHQSRLIHENRFDVHHDVKYELKHSRFSSHGRILNLVRENSVVLDIGCGPGLLAKRLSEKGSSVDGVDAEHKDRVWSGLDSYLQLDLEHSENLQPKRKYDYILMADVLEHVRNPTSLIHHAKLFLKEDGKLIASTGNIALWFVRLGLLLGRFNYGPRGILDETHVHLYTLKTFRKLIEESGFVVRSVSFTSLPFEVVFRSTGKSRVLRALDRIYYGLVRLCPELFAYQFVVEAELRSLDLVHGEGLVQRLAQGRKPVRYGF